MASILFAEGITIFIGGLLECHGYLIEMMDRKKDFISSIEKFSGAADELVRFIGDISNREGSTSVTVIAIIVEVSPID